MSHSLYRISENHECTRITFQLEQAHMLPVAKDGGIQRSWPLHATASHHEVSSIPSQIGTWLAYPSLDLCWLLPLYLLHYLWDAVSGKSNMSMEKTVVGSSSMAIPPHHSIRYCHTRPGQTIYTTDVLSMGDHRSLASSHVKRNGRPSFGGVGMQQGGGIDGVCVRQPSGAWNRGG